MSNNDTKRRRVGVDGATTLPTDNYGLVCAELKDIKSTMNEMMKHTRLQTQNMTNMMQMVKNMQGEIVHLTNECNELKHIIHETRDKCVDNGISISTMNSRFDDVDDKQQYHEVLLRNQQWKYSAPRPSPEYWVGLDEYADEETEAEEFLTQIQKCTEEMRYATGDGNINICLSIDGPINHNEEFLPHWKELANALEQHQYCLKCLQKDADAKLRLCGMELPDTVIELLSKSLESTHFSELILENNDLGQSGIEFCFNHFKRNKLLSGFTLVDNPIDMEQIRQLCQVVNEHPSIEKLALRGCIGEELDEMLRMILSAGKNKLHMIDLSNNSISRTHRGDTFISDFLADNPTLKLLDLSGNELDDNDAVAIAGSLKRNTNLRTLVLRHNSISKAGWAALRKAEFDETSLNSAADSNHTCTIWYPSGDNELAQGFNASEINGNSEYNFDPMCVRRKKIYSVLSSRNRGCTNVGHFDDVPVELLPDMLSTIRQYSEYHMEHSEMSQGTNDVNPLSIVYEVCRYWDKSLAVYELLSS